MKIKSRRSWNMKSRTKRIREFFSTLYILISDSMKKEAQTYREEREEQKKVKNNRPFKQEEW